MHFRVQRPALVLLFVSISIAFGILTPVLAQPAAAQEWSPPTRVWVEETGHTVDGYFLDTWRTYRDLLGLPITEEQEQEVTLADGKKGKWIVQYFERLAIVYVPEETREEWRVQALPLGREAMRADRPKFSRLRLPENGSCGSLSSDECTRFPETKRTLRHGFKAYWEANDGARLIGLPLTEEFIDRDGWTTQYFEHAVLRWKKGKDVTASAIGKEFAKRNKLKTDPVPQPVGIPVYDESLFSPPAVGGTGDAGPGPQQGGYKEIVVSISEQKMWAYEDGQVVVSTLVSTGTGNVPETVTPIGHFQIWLKYESQTMEGTISDEHYRVEDVPWVMYFDYAGNALHGTYWHSNFGTPMSHGCVNLPLDVAEFLYQWAPEGTPVSIVP
ncbi:MAG TPA: L,D-transpeptidase [Thermomicrobiales bacterium]